MLSTNIKNSLKKVFPSTFDKYNPLSKWLSLEDYKKLVSYPRFTKGNIKFCGHPLQFSDSLGLLHSIEEIFRDEIYLFQHHQERLCIVDCGSNIGLSVIYFKQLFPKAKIIAFEPDVEIFALLKQNIEEFNFSDVDLNDTAVWTEETTLQFYSEGSLAGTTETNCFNRNSFDVKTTDLKKILDEHNVNFLKIDIEGAENTLIFDLAISLKRIPYLFLEYHSIAEKDQQLGDILKTLSNTGYRYYIQSAASILPFPFVDNVNRGFDLQLNIFCRHTEEKFR